MIQEMAVALLEELHTILQPIFGEDVSQVLEFHMRRDIAASKIQSAWIHWSRHSHCRKKQWLDVRRRIGNLYLDLWRYPSIRREWRQEPQCWVYESGLPGLDVCDIHLHTILEECRRGLWGKPTLWWRIWASKLSNMPQRKPSCRTYQYLSHSWQQWLELMRTIPAGRQGLFS